MPQLRAVADTIVRSWWAPETIVEQHYEDTAARIRYWQQRNATAAKSHRKTRLAKLRALGIDLNRLRRCDGLER